MNNLEGVVNAENKAKVAKGPFTNDAKKLHTSGFFRAPPVWKAIGTDEQYQAWTRTQPCIVTGGVDWDEKKGVGRTEFAHVRRAGDSGTAYKGEYSGVPLVHEIHANYQHQHGEVSAYKYYLDRTRKNHVISPKTAKDWFDQKAAENVTRWAHESLCIELGYDSLTQVPPKVLRKWAEEKQVSQFLPKNYRDAA
jgi:hypothetical protein